MANRKNRIEDQPQFKKLIEQLNKDLRFPPESLSAQISVQETKKALSDLFFKGLEANLDTDLWDNLDYLNKLINISDPINQHNFRFKKYLRQKIISGGIEKSQILALKEQSKNPFLFNHVYKTWSIVATVMIIGGII